jgi:hypothetical protein
VTTSVIWLTDPLPAALEPGVFWCHTSQPLASVVEQYAEEGWTTSLVNLEGANDKAGILDAFADGLQFPVWVGRNWDALDDALRDLSWLPNGPLGRLVAVRGVVSRGSDLAADHRMLRDVLTTAVANWATTDSPLAVMLWR